ncbi:MULTISPECIES: hypothetical protein [unclassified Pseudonocardia]|uniref:hypothetical protein n=1 Tax=unclassified Pseudonocardia TaxID=2619320 RepID=UPI0001FFE9BC|nr:hypothetical protein [Pseudonocardia sp. Ae707_Ps1]OLM09047.1 hypothetical protein Ae707Ps1_5994 [Pseudonocardia sp. Ae707_Ps1]
MSDTRQPGWDDHTAKTDARMIELGLAEPGIPAPGTGVYYGDIMPPEWYEANAVRDLGLMTDGSFRALCVAQAEQQLLDARDDLESAREARHHEPSLVNLNAVCHANAAVHRAEQGLSEAKATEQQHETTGEPESRPVPGRGPTDEELAGRSFWIQQHAEKELDL